MAPFSSKSSGLLKGSLSITLASLSKREECATDVFDAPFDELVEGCCACCRGVSRGELREKCFMSDLRAPFSRFSLSSALMGDS